MHRRITHTKTKHVKIVSRFNYDFMSTLWMVVIEYEVVLIKRKAVERQGKTRACNPVSQRTSKIRGDLVSDMSRFWNTHGKPFRPSNFTLFRIKQYFIVFAPGIRSGWQPLQRFHLWKFTFSQFVDLFPAVFMLLDTLHAANLCSGTQILHSTRLAASTRL